MCLSSISPSRFDPGHSGGLEKPIDFNNLDCRVAFVVIGIFAHVRFVCSKMPPKAVNLTTCVCSPLSLKIFD